ncbi:biosynthetic-type acetolactate synthase large subunit [Bacillus tuaregi]|uniref:biosynthetic-type acetolactate synthase large subunit n=1 Tax=Bacillus tuaregi TaxID=1816695 RepID=UPI0008F81B67|nr:biosynthetic-type acetolactate synthase large subunit [Bacillus tuaregi]
MSKIRDILSTPLNTTDLIQECFMKENVEVIFTSSDPTLSSFSAHLQQEGKIQSVIMQHEQAIVHAADGYARATGKIGVVIIPAGSGITNAITGIATAQMDSVPLVIISIQPTPKQKMECDDSRTIDTFGMTLPIVKYYFKAIDPINVQNIITDAFKLAFEGRPGPILIEIQEELLMRSIPDSRVHFAEKERNKLTKTISPKRIEQVKNEIINARKPVLFVGGGVTISGAAQLVKEFVEKTNIPVVSTMMGLGAFPSDHPCFLGMVGMHGTYAANKAIHRSDLLICLGLRFSDRVTGKISGFSPKSRKIQVDIDSAEINKIIKVDIPIVSDVKDFLYQLNPMVESGNTNEWLNEVSSWQKKVARYSDSDSNSQLKPQQVVELLNRYSNSQAIVATDVGQHQIWTSHYYPFNMPRTFITSGGLGTMGYGLPAAIGAALAKTGKEVILVSGDGSFQMNFQELITVAQYQLPIKIAILKNSYLGMVRQWQEMFYQGRYSSVRMLSPNFVALASAYGIEGLKANNLKEADNIIQQAFQQNKPFIMEFDITEEENVFPIVPPGGNNTEALYKK